MMESILDAPMPAHKREDEVGGELARGQGGQAVDGLVLDLVGLDGPAFALDAEGDLAVGQAGLFAVGGEVEHPAASLLDPPVSLVRGAMLGGAYLRKLPIDPGQVAQQSGLIRSLAYVQ